MASTKKVTELTATKAALVSMADLRKWIAKNPLKAQPLTDAEGAPIMDENGKQKFGTRERTAISVTANCSPELYFAVINGCGQGGRYVSEGDLQYNALSIGVLTALHNAFAAYEPEGYVFTPGEVGSRGGEGVTKKLEETKIVVNELVQTLVPLVRAGVLDISQVPESSRGAVQALLAA